MTHRILLIQGHPDTSKRHLNHLLLDAYAQVRQRRGMRRGHWLSPISNFHC